MTNANDPSSAIEEVNELGNQIKMHTGLTKREMFAMAAIQGLLSSIDISQFESVGLTKVSVRIADELINALNENI